MTKTKIIFLIFFLPFISISLAQPMDPAETFLYPKLSKSGSIQHIASLSAAVLPEDIVESGSVIRAPLFGYDFKFSLPENFDLDAAVRSNIITWHFSLGVRWKYQFDRFAFALGYDAAYFTGKLTQFGFDSKLRGWINYPNISIGYKFNKFTLTAESELILLTSSTQYIEEIRIQNDNNFLSGFTVGLYIEQPLWKENYFLLGVKSSYTKFYYPLWAAYSTFNRYFWVPEFVVGFIL